MQRHFEYSQNTGWNITRKEKQTNKKKTQKTEQTKPPSKISTIKKNKCRRDLSIMVSWEAPFISLVQSSTSKAPITWQRFLQPTHQDAGEVHPSVHLKVSGLEHRRGRMGKQWLWCPGCQPKGHGGDRSSRKAVHTALSSGCRGRRWSLGSSSGAYSSALPHVVTLEVAEAPET